MARTIGKVKIKKLKELVNKVIEEEHDNLFNMDISKNAVEEKVIDRVPEEWFDIWESAWSEINRIVQDEIWETTIRK